MAIDIQYATESFRKYLTSYDSTDDKIRLKIAHTFLVKRASEAIAKRLDLSEEDRQLAVLIGLLHDIGRFEQLRIYNSFIDAETVDHAALGVKILFEGNKIRDFIIDDSYDKIIREAIANHNRYAIEEGLSERSLLHAKIIRDADKLDNYRVKLEDGIDTMIGAGITEKNLGSYDISDTVFDEVKKRVSILSTMRKTPMDIWVSYLAVTFDIYFKETLEIIKEEDYIDRLVDRVPYTNARTAERMNELRDMILVYIEERIDSDDKN